MEDSIKVMSPVVPDGALVSSVDEQPRDPLLECIAVVARRLGAPFSPGLITSAVAMDQTGRLPWHQVGPTLELMGLNYEESRLTKLPQELDNYPMILADGPSGPLVIHEFRAGDLLVWRPGDEAAHWEHAGIVGVRSRVSAIVVYGDPSVQRDASEPWHQRARAHWFWSEIRKDRKQFWPILLASALLNVLALALPLFSMNVYDRVIPNRASSTLWVLAVGVVLAFAIEFALRKARTNVLDHIGRRLDIRLSEKIYGRLMATPLTDRSGHTGNLVARVTEFATVRDFFASTTVVLIVDVLFLGIFVLFIAIIAGWLAMVPVIAIILMAILGRHLQYKVVTAARDAQADYGLQQTHLVESVAGVETLKSLAAEGVMLGRWRRLAELSTQSQQTLREVSSTAIGAASTFQQVSNIALIVGGYYLFDAGNITMGAIIAIVMLSSRALSPASQLAYLLTRWQQASQTLNSIQKMWEGGDERRMGSTTLPPTIRQAAIKLDNVRFAYPGTPINSLQSISLSVSPGERIAVIGRVASGKSTLGRLLCGMYQPSDGAMLIDGIDSRQYRPQELRNAFRFVAQDSNLFSGTIKDNLGLANDRATEQDMLEALRRVGADAFLSRDAGGFDRAVGEQGRQLSGGQRSFLTLARALMRPSHLLFLDEPTGAMDAQTEKDFVQSLSRSLTPSQTLVVATHRPALFGLCDRIIVLDSGRVVADGTREEIMAKVEVERE